MYNSWDMNSGGGTGWVDVNANNGALANGKVIPVFNCPSSPMPQLGAPRGNAAAGVNVPNYAGNAGTINTTFGIYTETRGLSNGNGSFGKGGFFVQGSSGGGAGAFWTKMKDISDGTSMTVCIVEQSDWCRDSSAGNAKWDCRSSGGGGPGYGWSMGQGNPGLASDRQHGLTTTQYQPGTKIFAGRPAGLGSDLGANFPIQSAHTGGSHILLGDGTVRFISDNINFATVLGLLCRDDGNALGEF